MKKQVVAVAVLGALSGIASAQSKVTLSGGIDLGLAKDYIAADKASETVLQTAGRSARSNFTISGSEDLGGRTYVNFLLNSRFRPETGATNPGGNNANASQFFRNSFVEVASAYGKLRLGRFLVPFQEYNGDFDPFGTDTVGSVHVNNIVNHGNVRSNSSIEYRTSEYYGFSALALVADKNGQGIATPTTRPLAFGLNYQNKQLRLAAATDKRADGIKTLGLYGSYKFGFGTIMAQFESSDPITPATTKVKGFSIGTKIPYGQFDFKAGLVNIKNDTSAGDRKKLGLGADYNLSKRTQLYADFGKLSGGTAASAEKAARFDIGIYHRF